MWSSGTGRGRGFMLLIAQLRRVASGIWNLHGPEWEYRHLEGARVRRVSDQDKGGHGEGSCMLVNKPGMRERIFSGKFLVGSLLLLNKYLKLCKLIQM